jgi:hypothetical protein
MRILSRHISRLRKLYKPKAALDGLRLTDKRIRRLERERIRKGKSFFEVFDKYRLQRIKHNEARRWVKYPPTDFLSLYDRTLELQKRLGKQEIIDIPVAIDFGPYQFDGPLSKLSMPEVKKAGHEWFNSDGRSDPEDYWVLNPTLVHIRERFKKGNLSQMAVIIDAIP